ncbi:hypothetical protein DXT96_25175 [Agrobacterium sp. ICMP 6402]|nr:hypothetical protein [Agrobacterium sp. ICMP 6402]MQB13137.1 hypothetical protein [Agrobacterium sp. ICMP 6402]
MATDTLRGVLKFTGRFAVPAIEFLAVTAQRLTFAELPDDFPLNKIVYDCKRFTLGLVKHHRRLACIHVRLQDVVLKPCRVRNSISALLAIDQSCV